MHAFGNVFDLEVSRAGNEKLNIVVRKNGVEKKYAVKEGMATKISL